MTQQQGITHFAGYHPEIPRVAWNFHAGQQVQNPVKQPGRQTFKARLPQTRGALAVNHIPAAVNQCHHLRNQLRRILEVGINDRNQVAGAFGQINLPALLSPRW